jgi:hypothetical protein
VTVTERCPTCLRALSRPVRFCAKCKKPIIRHEKWVSVATNDVGVYRYEHRNCTQPTEYIDGSSLTERVLHCLRSYDGSTMVANIAAIAYPPWDRGKNNHCSSLLYNLKRRGLVHVTGSRPRHFVITKAGTKEHRRLKRVREKGQ